MARGQTLAFRPEGLARWHWAPASHRDCDCPAAPWAPSSGRPFDCASEPRSGECRLWWAGFLYCLAIRHGISSVRSHLGCMCSGKHQTAAQQDAMRSVELQRQLSSAHLRALQMQLEPHFIFNTMNAITTLVELDRKQDALEVLAHLNTILKTGLKRTTPRQDSSVTGTRDR